MTDYYDDQACIELFLKAIESKRGESYKDKLMRRHSEWKRSRGLNYI